MAFAVLLAAFTLTVGSGALAQSSDAGQLVSYASTARDAPQPLHGATLRGRVYVGLQPSAPTSDIARVQFLIDGAAVGKTEGLEPYDLGGSVPNTNDARHAGYDSAGLSEGPHSINAVMRLDNGSSRTSTAQVSVDNVIDPTPTPTVRPTPTPTPTPGPTPPTAGVRVVAAGDIACRPGDATSSADCRHRQTSDLVLSRNPTKVIAAGDLQYEQGELSNFQRSYDPTWGRFKAITLPAPGNHEYGKSNASGYYDYWGPQAGVRGKGYYQTFVGSWQVIALNSNIELPAGGMQEQWLRQVLAASDAKCELPSCTTRAGPAAITVTDPRWPRSTRRCTTMGLTCSWSPMITATSDGRR
jgi:hypothetical protein